MQPDHLMIVARFLPPSLAVERWDVLSTPRLPTPNVSHFMTLRRVVDQFPETRLNEAARAADATREALGAVVASWLV